MPDLIEQRWHEVDALFQATLKRLPPEREAYLSEVTDGDGWLHREVTSLLRSYEVAKDEIGDSATAFVEPFLDELEPAPALRQVGPYRILQEVGRGGMGTVYLAERSDGVVERKVALKVVSWRGASQELVRRFRTEQRILASLEHPNISRLYDAGSTADGLPYLVMEHVQGEPITDYCDRRRLAIGDRLRLFEQVLGAVRYAHGRLVVHRDLKPSNILVDETGHAHLLDFGIAKLLDDDRADDRNLTQAGHGVLTPAYAAPEQVRREPVTTAADVYSLGVILHELTTGVRPGSWSNSGGADELPGAMHSRPSTHFARSRPRLEREEAAGSRASTPAALRKLLTGDIDTIVHKALQHSLARRYGSVEALEDDLIRYRTGRPIKARPDSLVYRARKFVARNRALTAAATVVVTAVAAFGVSTATQQAETARARDEAEAVAGFLEDLLTTPDPFPEQEDRSGRLTTEDFMELGEDRVRNELGELPAVQARMLGVLGRVNYKTGNYDRARSLLEESLERTTALWGPRDERVARTLQSLGGLHEETGAYDLAREAFARALDILHEIRGPDHPDVALAMSQLGYVHRLQGDLGRAESLIRAALSIDRDNARAPDIAFANNLTRFGILLQERGGFDGAVEIHREALQVRHRLFPAGHPRLATSTMNLAYALAQAGRYEEAEPLAREALRISRRSAGEDAHLKTATALNTLGMILRESGRSVEAEGVLVEALAMFVDLFGHNHPRVAMTLMELGAAMDDQGRAERAEEYYREALSIRERILPPDHPRIAEARKALQGR